jgi:hypothetical protein
MVGLIGIRGSRVVRAAARKRMPDPSSGQLPQRPPRHGLKLFNIPEGWIPTSLTKKARPETVMFYMAKCDVFT